MDRITYQDTRATVASASHLPHPGVAGAGAVDVPSTFPEEWAR